MKRKFQELRREQLSNRLSVLSRVDLREAPPGGWIRAIREALGMSSRQLARRIGVSQPTVANWERREIQGTISLRSLRKVAAAMECDLVHMLAPRKPLGKIREERAGTVAARQADQVSHSMKLEGQGTSAKRHRQVMREEARRLLEASSGRLWDD